VARARPDSLWVDRVRRAAGKARTDALAESLGQIRYDEPDFNVLVGGSDSVPPRWVLTKQMNALLILSMGRVAGVTAAETRERLLRAAADAFARHGYDGTRVADISAAAGVSNGALYAHFGSKAELLVAALRTHGRQLLAELFAAEPDRSITELLLIIGRSLPERRDPCGNLVIEGLAAARRDQDVAGPMRDYVAERADWIADVIRVAQADGEIDADLSAAALAHFCLLLVIGSGLVTSDLHPVSQEDWSALLGRIAAGLAPAGRTTQRGAPGHRPPVAAQRGASGGRPPVAAQRRAAQTGAPQ
jgi:AcrR family transcriptional regulator